MCQAQTLQTLTVLMPRALTKFAQRLELKLGFQTKTRGDVAERLKAAVC